MDYGRAGFRLPRLHVSFFVNNRYVYCDFSLI